MDNDSKNLNLSQSVARGNRGLLSQHITPVFTIDIEKKLSFNLECLIMKEILIKQISELIKKIKSKYL